MLITDMRVHLDGDHNEERFSRTLLDIGNGITIQNNGDTTVQINLLFGTLARKQNDLINKEYPQISQVYIILYKFDL